MIPADLVKPLVTAGSLAVLWTLEGLVPMFEGRRNRGRHDLVNLGLGVFNAMVASLLFAGATLAVTLWARREGVGLLNWLDLPVGVDLVLAVVSFDLWQYVWHRLNHRVPFLWRFHAVHHSDADLDASAGLRFHTGEILLSSCARLVVLPVLGLSIGHVLAYELVLLPILLFHHSNLRVPEAVDRPLRAVIVTPWMHWVHHSDWQPETDSNYSSIFSFWDRLFGSFRLRRDPHRIRLGLGLEEKEWRSFSGMMRLPLRRVERSGLPPDDAELQEERV
jgi:sterol desaturase/sphingolipid hydroxylase (fatty acid hydroxylase superfamily)